MSVAILAQVSAQVVDDHSRACAGESSLPASPVGGVDRSEVIRLVLCSVAVHAAVLIVLTQLYLRAPRSLLLAVRKSL